MTNHIGQINLRKDQCSDFMYHPSQRVTLEHYKALKTWSHLHINFCVRPTPCMSSECSQSCKTDYNTIWYDRRV